MKSKRDEDEGDDDFEWEEAPTAGMHQLTYFQFLNSKSEKICSIFLSKQIMPTMKSIHINCKVLLKCTMW